MFYRAVPRAIRQAYSRPAGLAATVRSSAEFNPIRLFSITPTSLNKKDESPNPNDPIIAATAKASVDASGKHEGQFARTGESVHIEYPPDSEMPAQPVVQGRGGMHFKRTLASFSLETKVSMVTGGARGLGLVMGQGLVASGSDLAIVDLISEPFLDFPFFNHEIRD